VISIRDMRLLVYSYCLDYGSLFVLSACLPFFVQYHVITPSGTSKDYRDAFYYTGVIGVSGFAASAASQPVWWWIYTKIGKRNAWLSYNAYNTISNIFFLVDCNGNWTLALGIFVVNAFAFGGQFLIDAVLADVIEYDQFLNGGRIEGMFATVAYFVPKVVAAGANAIPLALFYTAGFVEPLPGDCADLGNTTTLDECEEGVSRPVEQAANVVWLMRILMGVVPTVFGIVSFLIKRQFGVYPRHLEAIQKGIRSLLENPRASVEDPVTGGHVSWLPDSTLNADEVKLKRILDCFPMLHITRAKAEATFKPLANRALITVGVILTLLAGSLAATITTVSAGWLLIQQYAIIPTLTLILFGMSITLLALAVPRLRQAVYLNKRYSSADSSEPFPIEFLDRYTSRRREANTV
jgi:hypothetical protein